MMNDRERANVILLRRLVQIERGDTGAIGDAMRQLLVAVGARLVLLCDCGGQLNRHVSIGDPELDTIRVHVENAAAGSVVIDDRRTWACVPVIGAGFSGTVYASTRGVFVDADIELIQLFAQSVEAIGYALVTDAPGLHEEVLEFQYRRVRHALDRHGGNVSSAARALRIQRSFVYRLLRRTDNG